MLSRARVVFASRAWTRSWRDVRRVDVLGGGGGGGGARRRCPATATATAMSTTTTTTTPPSARATSPAAKSTLTYVDTHCHLDLIFRKMNEPKPPGKKRRSDAPDAPDDATAARSPSPASASSWDFASWRESVRRLDHSRRAEFHGASLDACLTVACSARAFAYAEALISGADAPPGMRAPNKAIARVAVPRAAR